DARRRHGTLSLEPQDDVVAGTYGSWTVTYTVGAIGMDDGARLKLAANSTSDWGPPQFDDPEADNYCTVETDGDASVEGRYDTRGHVRPFRNVIEVSVFDGMLEEGDTITVTLGARGEGCLGLVMQSFPERDFRLIGLVDAFETGEFVELPDDLTVDIVGGHARSLHAVAPSHATPGDDIEVAVRGVDYWGNVADGYDGTLSIETEDGNELGTVEADEGVASADVSLDESGVHRLTVVDADRDLRTTTNPVVCTADPDGRIYWGDIHGQSGETVGTGTAREYLEFARDGAFLDFASHAGNDFQITPEFWEELRGLISEFDDPGKFVTFLCYEWSANTPNGGDHNVYFRDDEEAIHRSSLWQVEDGTDRGRGTYPAEALYEAYADRDDVLIIPHRGGRPATLDVYDPDLTPFVEILSVWGIFEWYGQEALERGYDVGFVAGSDDHTGRPGASHPTNEADWSFPIEGGLMAARADGLSRSSLWDAFTGRRVYGTTGARILLDVRVADERMGGDVSVTGDPEIDVTVHGTAPVREVDLFRGSEQVAMQSFVEGGDLVDVTWTGARSTDRHKVQDWSGRLGLDRGRIAGVSEVGFDHPDAGVLRQRDTSLRWEGSTAGNTQRLRLDLDAPEDATMTVATEPVTTAIRLGNLPHSVDAGSVGRRLTIRRTGSSTRLDVDATFRDDDAPAGKQPYYVRVTQEDGEMAWSSPVFVTVE
ncbi:MAG: DUF3604 domain-containing protein, partial [Halovenus sp.]